jgi:hypothetical protein
LIPFFLIVYLVEEIINIFVVVYYAFAWIPPYDNFFLLSN